jgi:nucleoside diphosphate kinase
MYTVENTFILFKPNIFRSDIVYKCVIDKLKEAGLTVTNEYMKRLSPFQLCTLWPRLTYDKLLFYTTVEQFKRKTKILEISGIDAVKKVKNLKKQIRSMYASSVIRNCIHSPANTEEYKTHIKALHNNDNGRMFKPSFAELNYKSYSRLNDGFCIELAKFIVDISLYTMIPYVTPYYTSTKKYRYYLLEDDFHSFAEYVCFICDCFSQYTFYDSVVLIMVMLAYGEVCFLDTDDESLINTIANYANIYNMTIKRHEIT